MKSNFNKFLSKKNGSKGFTLVELMVVLVIVGLIVYLIYPRAAAWINKGHVSNLSSDRDSIVQCLSDNLTGYADTSSLSNDWAIKRKCVSSSRVMGTNTVKNADGGSSTVSPATLNNSNDAISFTDDHVRSGSCAAYAADKNDGFARIIVNGTTVKDVNGTLNDSALTSACTNSDSNSVSFMILKN